MVFKSKLHPTQVAMKPRAPSEAIQWIHLSTWVSGGHLVRRIPEPHLHHHRSRVATKGKKKNSTPLQQPFGLKSISPGHGWDAWVTSKLLKIHLSKCSLWFKVPPPYHNFFWGRVTWRWLKKSTPLQNCFLNEISITKKNYIWERQNWTNDMIPCQHLRKLQHTSGTYPRPSTTCL